MQQCCKNIHIDSVYYYDCINRLYLYRFSRAYVAGRQGGRTWCGRGQGGRVAGGQVLTDSRQAGRAVMLYKTPKYLDVATQSTPPPLYFKVVFVFGLDSSNRYIAQTLCLFKSFSYIYTITF